MSLFDNIPEGTDIIEVRKKVNKMLFEAQKKSKTTKMYRECMRIRMIYLK